MEAVLRAVPHRAGLACRWPYFRLYLLNVVWAVPLLPFVDDWTWMGLLKITGACAGVGFMIGFLASLIYRFTPNAGLLRSWMAIILAAPAGVLPILCAVSDGPEMLALAWRYHILTGWMSAILLYVLAVRTTGVLKQNVAGPERPD